VVLKSLMPLLGRQAIFILHPLMVLKSLMPLLGRQAIFMRS
jgi:hypothetical protein